jgi:hypothetical protein
MGYLLLELRVGQLGEMGEVGDPLQWAVFEGLNYRRLTGRHRDLQGHLMPERLRNSLQRNS